MAVGPSLGLSGILPDAKVILRWPASRCFTISTSSGRVADAHIGAIGVADRPLRLVRCRSRAQWPASRRRDDRRRGGSSRGQSIRLPTFMRRGVSPRPLFGTLLARGLKQSARHEFLMQIEFSLNGRRVAADVEPRKSLADCLRDDLGQTGTHLGCEHGVCGACTVLVNGDAVRACLMLAVQADGDKVVTVEGLSGDESDAAAGGIPQASRAAMRLLHARLHHDGACAADARAGCGRRTHPRRAVRKSVPLHRLCQIVEAVLEARRRLRRAKGSA